MKMSRVLSFSAALLLPVVIYNFYRKGDVHEFNHLWTAALYIEAPLWGLGLFLLVKRFTVGLNAPTFIRNERACKVVTYSSLAVVIVCCLVFGVLDRGVLQSMPSFIWKGCEGQSLYKYIEQSLLLYSVSLVGFVVLAPCCEEAFYRHDLWRAIGRGRWVPLTVSALLFSAAHAGLGWNPALHIEIFAWGIIFGVIRIETGSLSHAMMAHLVVNTVQCMRYISYYNNGFSGGG